MAEAAPRDALGGALVTVEEAAAFLGVKPGTVYVWAETGRIPSIETLRLCRAALLYFVEMLRARSATNSLELSVPLFLPLHHDVRGE